MISPSFVTSKFPLIDILPEGGTRGGKKEDCGKTNGTSESGKSDARVQARPVEIRRPRKGQKSEAGDRDWTKRSAQSWRKCAAEEEGVSEEIRRENSEEIIA
jgi:hypothetical protein